MREKLDKDCSSFFFDGITPACAGKTYCWLVPVGSRLGSPPRVREKLIVLITEKKPVGITPACAGKTRTVGCLSTLPKDHPRVCGKNTVILLPCTTQMGSPPRVREKQNYKDINLGDTGITPACAGKTAGNQLAKVHGWDHPRVCGKNLLSSSLFLTRVGSPPRVREKQV